MQAAFDFDLLIQGLNDLFDNLHLICRGRYDQTSAVIRNKLRIPPASAGSGSQLIAVKLLDLLRKRPHILGFYSENLHFTYIFRRCSIQLRNDLLRFGYIRRSAINKNLIPPPVWIDPGPGASGSSFPVKDHLQSILNHIRTGAFE